MNEKTPIFAPDIPFPTKFQIFIDMCKKKLGCKFLVQPYDSYKIAYIHYVYA